MFREFPVDLRPCSGANLPELFLVLYPEISGKFQEFLGSLPAPPFGKTGGSSPMEIAGILRKLNGVPSTHTFGQAERLPGITRSPPVPWSPPPMGPCNTSQTGCPGNFPRHSQKLPARPSRPLDTRPGENPREVLRRRDRNCPRPVRWQKNFRQTSAAESPRNLPGISRNLPAALSRPTMGQTSGRFFCTWSRSRIDHVLKCFGSPGLSFRRGPDRWPGNARKPKNQRTS